MVSTCSDVQWIDNVAMTEKQFIVYVSQIQVNLIKIVFFWVGEILSCK